MEVHLVPVPSAADFPVPDCTDEQQDHSNDNEDGAHRNENRHGQEISDDDEDHSENDHRFAFFFLRGWRAAVVA